MKRSKREIQNDYRKRCLTTKNVGYLGVMNCDRCGKKGYGYVKMRFNKVTEKHYNPMYVEVLHIHTDRSQTPRTVYDSICYLGTVK